jgi:hypothetical protein
VVFGAIPAFVFSFAVLRDMPVLVAFKALRSLQIWCVTFCWEKCAVYVIAKSNSVVGSMRIFCKNNDGVMCSVDFFFSPEWADFGDWDFRVFAL